MRHKLNPSLPEIVRVNSKNLDEAIAQLVSDLTPTGGGFNYLEATKCSKAAFKGLHSLKLLTDSKRLNDGSVGAKANLEVANLICPLAFGRKTSVVDLSPRNFQYGAGRYASYRIPFLFVENKHVKIYFLQPRKNTCYTFDQVSLYASIARKHLLEKEFYGELTDIEFVEAAVRNQGAKREIKEYCLQDLEIWDDLRISQHLSAVDKALTFIESEQLVKKKRRPLKDSQLPLFS